MYASATKTKSFLEGERLTSGGRCSEETYTAQRGDQNEKKALKTKKAKVTCILERQFCIKRGARVVEGVNPRDKRKPERSGGEDFFKSRQADSRNTCKGAGKRGKSVGTGGHESPGPAILRSGAIRVVRPHCSRGNGYLRPGESASRTRKSGGRLGGEDDDALGGKKGAIH